MCAIWKRICVCSLCIDIDKLINVYLRIDLLNCWPGRSKGSCEYRPAGIHRWPHALIRPNHVNPTPDVKQLVGDTDRFYTKYIMYIVIWHSGEGGGGLRSVVIHVQVAKNFGGRKGEGGIKAHFRNGNLYRHKTSNGSNFEYFL